MTGALDGDICSKAVDSWMSEKPLYKKGDEMAAGHYTQVIWRDSRRVGCGVAVNGQSRFVTCLYSPAGNVQGAWEKNV